MILVYINSIGGISKSSFEAVTYGKKLGDVIALSNGSVDSNELAKLGNYGATKVLVDRTVDGNDQQQVTNMIASCVATNNVDTVLFTHDLFGKSVAPRLSVKLKAGLVSGAISLPDSDGCIQVNVFSGKALGKAVAKQAYNLASEEVRDEYIKLFKRHIALNLTSMMQGYSNQFYAIVDSRYNQKNKTYMIDMEITNGASKIMVTWRVVKHKENFYIIDLYIANISLMQTKRSEFNSALKTVDNDLKKFNQILKKQNDLNYSKFID